MDRIKRKAKFLEVNVKSISLRLFAVWVLMVPFLLMNQNSAFAGTTYSFTNAGATGYNGPTQAQVNSAYTSTTLAGLVTVTTQGIQEFTIGTSGNYSFSIAGAHGAASTGASNTRGGRSVVITATRYISSGTKIYVVVGQAGIANTLNGGGGGASFVRIGSGTDNTNLIVAGGGGGTRTGAVSNGGDASTTTSGNSPGANYGSGTVTTFYPNTSANSYVSALTPPKGSTANAYTDVGYGGLGASSCYGDGGSGWFGDGFDDNSGTSAVAKALSGTAIGGSGSGSDGGFGGGGNGLGCNGGGGGGGYTGGNGGWVAGGGGSFASGFNDVVMAVDTSRSYLRNGTPINGYVTMQLLSLPTVSLTTAGNVTSSEKGKTLTLTATLDDTVKVTFYADGKKIAGCVGLAAVAGTKNCTWKPTVQKQITVYATISQAGAVVATSQKISVSIQKRTGTR
jgi:hypothetical protein